MPGTIIDMHMHTVLGAYDSELKPELLAQEARRVGLTGVNITEHDRMWDPLQLERYRQEHAPLFINQGMEVSTDMGHILAIGLKGYAPGSHKLSELRKVADNVGAFLIVAHPFRHWFDRVHFMRKGQQPPSMVPEDLAELPVFEYVHAIEVLNGCNTYRENLLALQVAKVLGKPGTGGSDCHSAQGIGYFCTVFEESLETPAQMLEEMHAGRFQAAHDLAKGNLTLFTETSLQPPS
jgi:predicted metal-dependent phosphoesterase TrpH